MGEELKQTPPAKEEPGLHTLAKEVGAPLSQTWMKRWPWLAVISLTIIVLSQIGNILGGLALLSDFINRFIPNAPIVVTPPPASAPLTAYLAQDQTRMLDGYQLLGISEYAIGSGKGKIYPVGVQTRLTLQATDPSKIIEIERISVEIKPVPAYQKLALNYNVDPLKVSGFGPAKPREFQISLTGGNQAQVQYLADDGTPEASSTQNILPRKALPILRLDAQAGLQETLDFAMRATKPGLYEIRFRTTASSDGKEYQLESDPIFIFSK